MKKKAFNKIKKKDKKKIGYVFRGKFLSKIRKKLKRAKQIKEIVEIK